jgi:diguanylate cyclase
MNDIVSVLKSTSLFSQLNDTELQIIADYSGIKTYKDDEIIFKEGSFSESLYIVSDGEVRIIKQTEDQKERDIAKFIRGEVFGELDLFENTNRTATAKAEEITDPHTREKRETSLVLFPRAGVKFPKIIKKHPDMFARILHVLLAQIASRIRSTNKLVSEKTQWIDDLRKQVLYDKLTGLYNRTFLTEDFALHLPQYGKHTSVIAAKPDNFKYINDSYGHDVGDRVLRLMADTIKSCIRENDFAVRYKSDEFIIILPNTDDHAACSIAGELKAELSHISIAHIVEGDGFTTSWSLGIATYPIHEDDAQRIVTLSFNKMLEQRNAGGNGVLCA